MNDADALAMREAIRLSRRGFPAPNPQVGCVIVADGQIVGRGYHVNAGGDHAEVVALREAGSLAAGATLYVTLEPCRHHGRTPPCTEAILQAGITRVVAAVPDPNPIAGGGLEQLLRAGISAECGLLRAEAELPNAPWLIAMRRESPFVSVKAAITLDGYIARLDGTSQWITGTKARREGHRLRALRGSVLVGSGTVLADNPRLTARIQGVANQPVRIVLDPRRRLTGRETVFSGPGRALWFVGAQHADQEDQIGLATFSEVQILSELWQRGIGSVLIEGGGETIRRFLTAGVVDELHLFVGHQIFGDGISWLGRSHQSLDLAEFHLLRTKHIAGDAWLHYAVSKEFRNMTGGGGVK